MAAPTLQQIRTEIDTDPKTLGYAALKVQSNGPQAVSLKMNLAGASAETLFKSYVATEDITPCVLASEYSNLSPANKALWNDLVTPAARLKTGDANMRNTVVGIFPAGTASLAALTAVASRAASRAEALWGEGVGVTIAQVSEALSLP